MQLLVQKHTSYDV